MGMTTASAAASTLMVSIPRDGQQSSRITSYWSRTLFRYSRKICSCGIKKCKKFCHFYPADCWTGWALCVGQLYLADKRIIDSDFLSAEPSPFFPLTRLYERAFLPAIPAYLENFPVHCLQHHASWKKRTKAVFFL